MLAIAVPIAIVLLLMMFTVLVILTIVIVVRRKQQGQELDMRIYDTVHNTANNFSTQQPHNYEIPQSIAPTGTGANTKMKNKCRTANSVEDRRKRGKSNPKTSQVTMANLKGDHNTSSMEREDEYVEMYEDMSGADAEYQAIQESQVQVHHYASLGVTAGQEGIQSDQT